MTADDTKVLDKKDVNSYLTTPDYIPPAQQPTKDTQHSLRVSVPMLCSVILMTWMVKVRSIFMI